jgi:hypothetical protein
VADTRRTRRARRGRPAKTDPPPTEAGYRLAVEVEALDKPEEENGWTVLATTVRVEAGTDAELLQAYQEQLMRYTARGAVSLERLTADDHGDLVYRFTHSWSDGTTGIRLAPLELLEKLAALVPLPRVHLVRYGGCLTPHSHLRGAIRPTPRQQGMDGEEAKPGTPYWPWARLLGHVFGLEMATCPFCRHGALRIIAVITQESVIPRILQHLQLASVPPPLAPARGRQEIFAFD